MMEMLQSAVVTKTRIYHISESTFIQLETGVKNKLSYYLLFKTLFSLLCEKLTHRMGIQAMSMIYR